MDILFFVPRAPLKGLTESLGTDKCRYFPLRELIFLPYLLYIYVRGTFFKNR